MPKLVVFIFYLLVLSRSVKIQVIADEPNNFAIFSYFKYIYNLTTFSDLNSFEDITKCIGNITHGINNIHDNASGVGCLCWKYWRFATLRSIVPRDLLRVTTELKGNSMD